MRWLQEFKTFALRGNVVDMAVGIVIGAAFGKIVSSLVANVVMPPLGLLLGNLDFADYRLVLREGQPPDVPPVTLDYGIFLTAVVDFVILAFAIFMLVRWVNRLAVRKPAPPPAPTTKECPRCLSSIALKATRCPHCTSELAGA